MPISVRLPAAIEEQISGFGARLGITKSAVIVRSIQEFLARHAQPTSLQIFEEAVRKAQLAESGHQKDAPRQAAELREHKLKIRAALRRKHNQRSAQSA
jgi:hypothetical protein